VKSASAGSAGSSTISTSAGPVVSVMGSPLAREASAIATAIFSSVPGHGFTRKPLDQRMRPYGPPAYTIART